MRKLDICESRFMWKNKLLAYHLEDLHVPLLVRAAQVGKPWFSDFL